ncbi:CBS domain-containing protein [Rhizobium sp. KVB221]|uniref:CBS domain-containing protein n=1 Tax=Rhizobium setariae TaxID=2801340 RepID=A0A936YVE5_9HYPH|nr:CBS domain-containing protein [Rhizobium setariae]MBL0373590.1 CBS domain-containing protein [Rhizobium setariae]
MQAKDVMTTTIVSVSPENSVRHAAEIMLINHVSGLPVIDNSGLLVGIISEGDLIRRTELGSEAITSLSDGVLPAEERAYAFIRRSSWKIGDAMSRNPIAIDEDTSLARISRLMQEHGIKRIPVTRNGELIGIVSRADLLKAIIMAELDEIAAGDEALRRSITVRLGENTGLEGFDLKVTVSDGIVHLWGDVTTEDCRRAACIVAENVRGVRGVVEHFSQQSP